MSKKIGYRKLAHRITGFSTSIVGVSWNPPEDKRDIARDLVTSLEDKRSLYYEYDREHGPWVNQSVLDMRRELTEAIKRCADDPELADPLRAMRGACKKFLDETDPNARRIHHPYRDEPAMWTALGELRALFGLHLSRLCVAYGVDIEPELATIFPASDEDPAEQP